MTHTARRRRLPGQVLVLMAAALVALAGFSALALDVGMLLATKRSLQNAADAAALAGARALLDGQGQGGAQVAAATYADKNVFGGIKWSTPSSPGQFRVEFPTPNTDPLCVAPAGLQSPNPACVKVQITKVPIPSFFLQVVYTGEWAVSATATARIATSPQPYALLALDQIVTDPGVYFNGNTKIIIKGGGARSNAGITSNGNVTFQADGCIVASGGINQSGTWTSPCVIGNYGAQVSDPLAGITPPPVPAQPTTVWQSDCSKYQGPGTCYQVPGCNRSGRCTIPSGTILQPGYCSNLTLTLNDSVTFAPGTYYFDNCQLTVSGQNVSFGQQTPNPAPNQLSTFYFANNSSLQVQSTVVSFYNSLVYVGANSSLALGNTNSGIAAKGVMIYVNGSNALFDPKNGTLHIEAFQPDPSRGLVLYQNEPNLPIAVWIANGSTFDAQGNGEFFIQGIFYAPGSTVSMHGNPVGESQCGNQTCAVYGQIIAKDVSIKGTSDFLINYNSSATIPELLIQLIH